MSITFTHVQAEALLECFGGDKETTITVMEAGPGGHSGPGLYAVCDGSEDEGSIYLGPNA